VAVIDPTPTSFAEALRGRYLLERELGQGGMATVYLARDLKHDRVVALKVLRPELSAILGPERFLREIRVTAGLQHPHILPLLDSGEAGGLLYYVMPYVEGESLRQRLERDGQLPLHDTLRISRAVASALQYAHEQGIIHRDIKPENILLYRGEAMLADFGIALAAASAGRERLTETGLSLGTPAYMSPEQAMAEPRLDGRSDQHSLASVLYEMLAGEPPYTGPTAQAIVAKRMVDPIPSIRRIRAEVPASVDAAIRRALARAPADRFASVAEFGAALAPEAIAAAGSDHGRSRGRRLRHAIAGAAVLAAIAIVGKLASRAPLVSPTPQSRRVVVMPFDNHTGSPDLDGLGFMAADWISQQLAGSGLVEVVDTRTLFAALKTEPGARSRDALVRETQAGTLVVGAYYRDGDSLRLQAQIVDGVTGRLARAIDPVTAPAREPVAALDPLRERVTGALAILLDDRLQNWTAATSRPPNYEAYQEFLRGMENYGRDPKSDLGHFVRAAQLDSSYAQAVLWAGIVYADMGLLPEADSVFRLLEPQRERLAPYDQATLDYFQSGWTRDDWDGAHRAAMRMEELAPMAGHAHWAVALSALSLNRPREALRAMRRIDPERGWGRTWPWIYLFHVNIQHQLGDYDAEAVAALKDRERNPSHRAAIVHQIRPLAATGRINEIEPLIREAIDQPSDTLDPWPHVNDPGEVMRDAALELREHGHPDQAHRLFERAIAWYRQQPPAFARSRVQRLGLAVVTYHAGLLEEAESLARPLDTGAADSTSVITLLGVIAAGRGDTATAQAMDRRLARDRVRYARSGSPPLGRARIAAASGDRARAVQVLRTSLARGHWYTWLDLHAVSEFESLRGYAPFDELVRPKE
jgi:tRNA A-37 threonylcarbamoyl transferase component Bud32/TolB-like protein